MSMETPNERIVGSPDPLPHTRFSRIIDAFITAIGRIVSWIWLLLIGVIMLNVTMRYVFGEGRIEFEEIQWHLYSIGFLIGLSYALQSDGHVRVDVLHERFGPRTKAWIELFGLVVFLIPFCILLIRYGIPFAAYSYSVGEVSDAPAGLSHRWVIKAMLALGMALLLIAALSRLSRATALLFGFPARVVDTANQTSAQG
jgi:TRAP-type mannitol/chloroaromatic compound transport system permease small subunit